MKTIVIAGNDTDVGKTRVTAMLTRELSAHGSVQVIKPVETGVEPGGQGDVEFVMDFCDNRVEGHTLLRFREPMAPVAAAALEGVTLTMEAMLARFRELPEADFRVVEGAGGIASPLDVEGRDLRDLAMTIKADMIVLVAEDRLGAINQSRLAHAYTSASGISVTLWLNEVTPQSERIRASNREAVDTFNLNLCALLSHEAPEPTWIKQPWLTAQPV